MRSGRRAPHRRGHGDRGVLGRRQRRRSGPSPLPWVRWWAATMTARSSAASLRCHHRYRTGGVGKTQLVLDVAADLAEGEGAGAVLVVLAAVTETDRVPRRSPPSLSGDNACAQGPGDRRVRRDVTTRPMLCPLRESYPRACRPRPGAPSWPRLVHDRRRLWLQESGLFFADHENALSGSVRADISYPTRAPKFAAAAPEQASAWRRRLGGRVPARHPRRARLLRVDAATDVAIGQPHERRGAR